MDAKEARKELHYEANRGTSLRRIMEAADDYAKAYGLWVLDEAVCDCDDGYPGRGNHMSACPSLEGPPNVRALRERIERGEGHD